MSRIGSRWLDFAAAGLWLCFLIYLVARSGGFGWDFHVYQQAAQALLAGRDPLEDPYLVHVGGVKTYLPFIYPPLTLLPFLPFAFLSKTAAYLIWVPLQIGGFALLARVWKRSFLVFPLNGKWGLFLLLAFNASLYTCFATGNFALFEGVVLFLAMEALLKKRDYACSAWIVLAACFKMQPILYLGLLLWLGGKDRVRAAAYGMLAFILYAGANLALFPRSTFEMLQGAMSREDSRSNNPSLLAFAEDFTSRAPIADAKIVYLLLAGLILAVSVFALRRWNEPDPALRLLFVMLTISLVLPRFMIYSYIQTIPVAWIVLTRLRGIAKWSCAALVCVVLPFSYLLIVRPSLSILWEHALGMQAGVWGYASLYGAILVWAVFLTKVVSPPIRLGQSVETA
ncbi:MAG: glycosyltransferase family 87 protein [Fimbriimonas sp.]|nr:glycosyltransferase family 87 protein [Fimbriimonas sp.]